MENDTKTIHTVRVPGQSSWAECETLDEARTQCELANRICQPGHIIVRAADGFIEDTFRDDGWDI